MIIIQLVISNAHTKAMQDLILERVMTLHTLTTEGWVEAKWDANDQVDSCHNCHSPFNFVNRKQYWFSLR